MLMHEKLMAGQFLLDMTNERSGLLQTAASVQTHPQQTLNLSKSSSPIMPPFDIYAVYQQQLQQQLPAAVNILSPQSPFTAEVLDLSRRNLPEATRKTPSPYHTNSSFDSGSPASSPNSLLNQQRNQSQSQLLPPPSLLYAAQQHHQQHTQNINCLPALYPRLYFPAVVNKETNNSMESFASPANTSLKHDFPEPHSPPLAKQMNSDSAPTSVSSSLDAKSTRPFKAFPRDPLVIAANFAATDVLLDNPRVERYTEYRKRVLEQIRSSNGGSHTVSNPKMRRTSLASGNINEGSSSNTSENEERHHEESSDCDSNFDHDNSQQSTNQTSKTSENSANGSAGGIVKDAAYYERRRKNNAAAKKSRDRRRIKEDEIAIRAAYLERQNIELLCQLDALKAQLAALTK